MRCATVLPLAACVAACAVPLQRDDETDIDALPLAVVAPSANPITPASRELGLLLFWDPILSGNRDIACASCHDPAFGYADGRARSLGTGGAQVGRNSPTLLNVAWNGLVNTAVPLAEDAPMFWDNRVRSLEAQALGPLHAQDEMRGAALSDAEVSLELPQRLAALPEYVARFDAAFGSPDITEQRIAMAIASFERTLTSGTSPFDRFMRGDDAALSVDQKRGLVGFFAAGCANCHGGPMFSDFQLHDIGAGVSHGTATDLGDGQGRFRTPTLRNITRTAPYMHDGSLATLGDVYDFYVNIDTGADPKLAGNGAVVGSAANDMTAFLQALADDVIDEAVPAAVPSGLPVGGTRRRAAGDR